MPRSDGINVLGVTGNVGASPWLYRVKSLRTRGPGGAVLPCLLVLVSRKTLHGKGGQNVRNQMDNDVRPLVTGCWRER